MNKLTYEKIYPCDYEALTNIMIGAFNEDTAMHTEMEADGPTGYNDGSLIKRLNEHENYESYKVIYEGNIIGAYTIANNYTNEFSLEMLFITPKLRGFHLGSMVWKYIEEKYSNAKLWTVETPDYSIRNHHFYTINCGFTFLKENRFDNGSKSFVFHKEK